MNNLSVNADKSRYIFPHKQRDKENIPLRASDLKINNVCVQQLTNQNF